MAERPLNPPVLLSASHEIAGFDCGSLPLNTFLTKFALQAQGSGGARTYVLTRGNEVIGFYSLAPASILPEQTPACVHKGQGHYPIPAILMARFAVALDVQGKGFGKTMLRDAMRRAHDGAEVIGGRAFLVHAKDDKARNFYLKFGMEPSPTNPLHLFLLFKDIRISMRG